MTMKASESASIRAQIQELQAKLAEADAQERAEALVQMKEWQRQYSFNGRELGPAFRTKKRGA
jgi:hypothetical protein